MQRCNQCAVLVSEENDDPIVISEEHRGGYCVTFDPLDGSSNIDCGVSIGTIFGIYPVREGSTGDESDVLRVRLHFIFTDRCVLFPRCRLRRVDWHHLRHLQRAPLATSWTCSGCVSLRFVFAAVCLKSSTAAF